METTRDLSVVIVNYRSEHHLDRCLTSVYAAGRGLDMEIIITNNYPEETLDGIQKKFPKIRLVINEQNGGFGHGSNLGAAKAGGRYILFINPDTEILEGALKDALDKFEEDPGLGALGAQLVTFRGEKQEWSAGNEVTFFELAKNNFGFASSRKIWESDAEKEAAWLAGTALFMPRELYSSLGGFDERIFMYFEDVDLCRRARAAGRRIVYYPKLKVLHNGGGSCLLDGKRVQKNKYYDSLVYYFKKNRPRWEYLAVAAIRKVFFV